MWRAFLLSLARTAAVAAVDQALATVLAKTDSGGWRPEEKATAAAVLALVAAEVRKRLGVQTPA